MVQLSIIFSLSRRLVICCIYILGSIAYGQWPLIFLSDIFFSLVLVETQMCCQLSSYPMAINSSSNSSWGWLEKNILQVLSLANQLWNAFDGRECFLPRGWYLPEWPPNQMGSAIISSFYVPFTACKHLLTVLQATVPPIWTNPALSFNRLTDRKIEVHSLQGWNLLISPMMSHFHNLQIQGVVMSHVGD